MKLKTTLLAISLAVTTSGCVSLSQGDEAKLRELRSVGISPEAVQKKNPGTAGALNILPGIGNFYLASGTNQGSQWTYGFLNLLTWPLSIVWGIPQAATDAATINKMETVYYYTYTNEGKLELDQRKAMTNANAPSAPSSAIAPASQGGF